MDEYEGFLQTEFTDIDQRHITGAVSLPLIPGVLSMRVAGDLNYAPSATEVKNITNGKENGNRSRAGRITLDWRPNDKLEMGLMFQRPVDQNTTYGAFYSLPQCNPINTPPAGETVCTNNGLNNAVYPPLPPHIGIDDRTALAAGPSHANAQQSIYQFRSSYDLGDSRLFFTAAHIDAVQEVLNDNDVTNFRPGYRFVGETYLSTAPFKQDSAELRWQSTDDDRWQYMYGLFYSKNATNGSLYTDVGYLAPSTIGGVPAAYQYAPGPNSLNPLYVLRTSLPYDQGTES
jgi:iron complex outermembrane receptor protein